MAGSISKLCWPECLHVLGYECVDVVEPGLCAPLNPEERPPSVMRTGAAGQRVTYGLFSEFVSGGI